MQISELDRNYLEISPATAVRASRVDSRKDKKINSTRETTSENISMYNHEAVNTASRRQSELHQIIKIGRFNFD